MDKLDSKVLSDQIKNLHAQFEKTNPHIKSMPGDKVWDLWSDYFLKNTNIHKERSGKNERV